MACDAPVFKRIPFDAENAVLADKYGIVMGSSHAEPLLRNNLGELYPYQQQWLCGSP